MSFYNLLRDHFARACSKPIFGSLVLPDLFAEGQGVVMTGKLINENTFIANEVLAKHDENYMPPEVADMMKEKEGSIYKNDN